MKRYILFLLLFIIVPKSSLSLIINEVYPNPQSTEGADNEWIEVFAEKGEEGNWSVKDLTSKNFTFYLNITGFLILARNKTEFLRVWNVSPERVIEIDINNLNNDGDSIFIFRNSKLVDNVTYPSFVNKRGKSYARFNNSWVICDTPTPLSPNFCGRAKEKEMIELVYVPKKSKFGSSNILIFKFNSNDLEYSKIKFLVYGYPKRVVVDTNQKRIIRFSSCDADTSLTLNISPNISYIISLPFFIYPNCDNYYKEGIFQLGLRVCYLKNESWKTLEKVYFNLTLAGKNENLCPKKEIIYKTVERVEKEVKKEERDLRILSSPTIVRVGEEFDIVVEIRNNENLARNYSIYSYVYSGRKLISEGFDGYKWKKTWNANKKIINLAPGEAKRVVLRNRIKNNVTGMFTLKVRVKGLRDEKLNLTILPEKRIQLNYTCLYYRNASGIKLKNEGDELKVLIIYLANKTETMEILLGKNQTRILKFPSNQHSKILIVYEGRVRECSFFFKKERPTKRITTKLSKPNPIERILTSFFFLIRKFKVSNPINIL